MILHLTLKKKWFDMIASGEKKHEYREIKQYWINRFLWHEHHEDVHCLESLKDAIEYDSERGWLADGVFTKKYDKVLFKNGYSKNAPKILLELKSIGYGEPVSKWSDDFKEQVFILYLGEIIKN